MSSALDHKIDITSYTDYVHFIRDLVDQKRRHEAYSFRIFCKKSGFKSPVYLKWVLDGKRPISIKSVEKFAQGLELDIKETEYLQLLVSYKHSKDDKSKHFFYQEILAVQNRKRKEELTKDRYECLSHWYYIGLRELANYDGFNEDPQWLREHLFGDLGVVEIKHALSTLVGLKLLVRDENQRLKPHDIELHSPREVASHAAYHYHDQVLELSRHILVATESHEREVSSLTSMMDKQSFEDIKTMMGEFQNKVVQYLTSESVIERLKNEKKQELYMMNMQLLPFSKIGEK